MNKFVLIGGFLILTVGILAFGLSSPNTCLFQGKAYLNSGKVARAIEVLKEGSKKYPDNYNISFTLSKAYLASGEAELASRTVLENKLQNHLKKNKELQDFFVDLSEANKRIGNEKLAGYFSLRYLESHDKNVTSKDIVENYIRVGQVLQEKSLELWEKAYNIASATNEKELKESIKTLLLPKYIQMVETLKLNKDYNEALNVLGRAKVLGTNAQINFQEALIYTELKKNDLAQNQFEEALQLEPENNEYKLAYANALEYAAHETKDKALKTEYLEKIKLLLAGTEDSLRKTNLLNKVINSNSKFKISDASLKISPLGEYLYPSFAFKIKPVSEVMLEKYKVIFFDENKNELDTYEAQVTEDKTEQVVEVTSRNPVSNESLVNAKLFLNGELVKEYTNK